MKRIKSFKLFEEAPFDIENEPRDGSLGNAASVTKKWYEEAPKMRGGRDDSDKDVYVIWTKEISDRKSNQKLRSYAHDAYHIHFKSEEELKELKEKYPVGAKYKGETITFTTLLDSRTLGG